MQRFNIFMYLYIWNIEGVKLIMNKKSMLIFWIVLVTLLSSAYGVFASGAADSLFKANELKTLEQEKANFERQNRKVPDELMAKIKLETDYSKEMAEKMKKREQEIQQIQEKRNNAPKDSKGNVIIQTPVLSDPIPKPYEEAGQVGDRDYAESNIALCNNFHTFKGKACNAGHPLKEENKAIREKLIRVFEPWYFAHNDENDEHMCYVKIVPESGVFHKDGTGYRVDFIGKTAEEFPFAPTIKMIG